MSNDSALLIGVDNYRTYDASMKYPPGTSDLQSGIHDVRAWLRLCGALGIRNIRLLTSPALPPEAAPGVDCREASAEAIREGVAWLAERLGGDKALADASKPVGLLVFSGHGDQTHNEGLVLCPSDVVAHGHTLENVVSLAHIQQVLAEKNAEPNLTVVLDCCHAGGGVARGGSRVRSLRPGPDLKEGPPLIRPRLGERMFCAAAVGEPAYQIEVGADDGVAHGAFSWAFLTARNRWVMRPQGSTNEISLSYSRMRDAVRDLLRALDVEQEPELDCRPGTAALPLFHRGLVARHGETSYSANAGAHLKQCDPGFSDYRLYTFKQGSTTVATMLVARTTQPDGHYVVGTEYWFMENVPDARSTTTVSMVDNTWSTTPPDISRLSFTMVQAATWANQPPNNARNPLQVNSDGSIGIQWLLTYTSGVWGGSIIWSRSPPHGSNLNTLFAGTPQTQTFPVVVAVPSTLTWCTTVPVQ